MGKSNFEGKHHSEKTRERFSEIAKKRPFNPRFTTKGRIASSEERIERKKMAKEKGFGKWMLGKKLSNETKDKIRKSHLGKKYKPMSEIGRKNIGESGKGRLHTEEWKIQMSKNNPKYWLGKKRPEISKLFSGQKRPEMSGEKSWNWKGGLTKLQKKEKIAGRKRPEQCELCGSLGQICFDHDHKTGKFRGWICHRCNFVLGLVKDNKELLTTMIEYLRNFNQNE